MKTDDFIIEDAADANYFIRKFFKDELSKIKMSQLEQLVLAVYNMGKNNGAPAESASAPPAPVNPFKMSDRAKAIEDIEIGHSGEFIKANTVGTISSVNEDKVSFLYETDEDGEMLEVSVLCDKLEKID